MPALDATADDRPPVPDTDRHSTVYRNYEYVRLGTLPLLAAIDLLTGEATPFVSPTHKSPDFVRFLKMLDGKYPAGDKIRLILDNHSAHTSRETQEYLNTVPGRLKSRLSEISPEAFLCARRSGGTVLGLPGVAQSFSLFI